MKIIKDIDLEGKGVVGQDDQPELPTLELQNKFEEVARYHISVANQNSEEYNTNLAKTLLIDNTTPYNPVNPYEPATKGYVDGVALNSGSVSSVFGRAGDVTAQNGDYTTQQITETGNKVFLKNDQGAVTVAHGDGTYSRPERKIRQGTYTYTLSGDGTYVTASCEDTIQVNEILELPIPNATYNNVSVTRRMIIVRLSDPIDGYESKYQLNVKIDTRPISCSWRTPNSTLVKWSSNVSFGNSGTTELYFHHSLGEYRGTWLSFAT